MPAHIKARITKQFEEAFKHTPKDKHIVDEKETKTYARCVSLYKNLKKTLKTHDWKGSNVITSFKIHRATEKTHVVIFLICVAFRSCWKYYSSNAQGAEV